MEFGTEAQKAYFLPRILRGELHFSIGYTEPSAGTDLASLRTTAVRDGDQWVINGQKIYTSLASYADYIWLAARTDPDVPKHAGITIFAVPTTDPGFSYSKIDTMVNASTFNTFYDDVRVGDDAIIGELHGGWNLITNQLNYERVSLGPPGHDQRSRRVRGRLVQDDQARGRTAGDRPGMGAGRPRASRRRSRRHHPDELEGGLLGRSQPGRRIGDEDLRHRVLPRGLPPDDGHHRAVVGPAAWDPRGRARRPARARPPGLPDPHLRRRDQRDPTRPRRPVRPRPARVPRT